MQWSKLFLAIFLYFNVALSFGQITDGQIDKLLELSGINAQFAEFPGLIKAGMEQTRQQNTALSEEQYLALLKSVDESVKPSEIRAVVRTALNDVLNEDDITVLLSWYDSGLARKITQAEKNASTPQAYQQMLHSEPSLLANNEKVEFAQRLDQLLGTTEMAMHINEHTSIAVYSAVMVAIKPQEPLNLEPFKQQMAAHREQSRSSLERLIILSHVYSYQGFDTKDLEKYEEFLNHDSAIKFNKIVMDRTAKGLKNAIDKL